MPAISATRFSESPKFIVRLKLLFTRTRFLLLFVFVCVLLSSASFGKPNTPIATIYIKLYEKFRIYLYIFFTNQNSLHGCLIGV
jgi:hypothetical protein